MAKMKFWLMMIALALSSLAIGQQRMATFDRSVGGNQSALNVTAAAVINPQPCVLYSVIVVNPGTDGTLTLNDTTTVGGASSSNTLVTVPSGSLTAGQQIVLQIPIASGIVVSSMPTGGAINIGYSFSAG